MSALAISLIAGFVLLLLSLFALFSAWELHHLSDEEKKNDHGKPAHHHP